MKITGVKKAVGEYKRYNKDYYSPEYGLLMLDRNTGEVWVDYFYSLGHNSWKEYHDPAIINLVNWVSYRPEWDGLINMKNVRVWAEEACAEYAKSMDKAK